MWSGASLDMCPLSELCVPQFLLALTHICFSPTGEQWSETQEQ